MIKKLNQTNSSIAEKMHSVFQVSYAVEAQVLKATDFPPLQRSLEIFTVEAGLENVRHQLAKSNLDTFLLSFNLICIFDTQQFKT